MIKKILITGGAGFIGSSLAEKYIASGNKVIIIDNFSTSKIDNIKHLFKYKKKIKLIKDSIFNKKITEKYIKESDIIFHLAAAVGVKYILDNPLDSISTNVLGTELILKLASKHNKKVLIASSSEVYGIQKKSSLSEDDNVILGSSSKSRWNYAVAKLMDEILARAYFKSKKLKVIVVRFFNTVGPRQIGDFGMVIPRIINNAKSNKDIIVHGSGRQTRTFTHVNEVVECIMKLINNKLSYGEVINIGGVEEISILNLAKKIRKKLNSKSKIRLVPYNKVYNEDFEDMPRRVPNTLKLKKIIGFIPKMKLDDILDDIINSQIL